MKKFNVILSMALVAAIGLTSCSDDNTPAITRLAPPVLQDLTGTIDGESAIYTFNWTPAKFYMDGESQSTSVGSYEYNGVQYILQGDRPGNNFDKPVTFGSTTGKDYVTLRYEDMATIMTRDFGMVRSYDEESELEIEFRVKAIYGSIEDICAYSEPITTTFTLTPYPPVSGDKGKIYICDNANWGAMALYAWPQDGVRPDWPGIQPSGTIIKNNKTYYEFALPDEFYDVELNYIANNNDNGLQIDIMQGFSMGSDDVYVTIYYNEDGALAYTIDEDAAPRLYLKSDLGWNDYSMYVWAGGGDVLSPWPGEHYTTVVLINDEEWYEFDMPREYSKAQGTNWIINNNNNGLQFDLMQGFTFDHDVFVRVAADGSFVASSGPIATQGNEFVIYADISDSGWDELAFYVWGEKGELCGLWPGQMAKGPLVINGKPYYYYKFDSDVDINVIPNNNDNGSQCPDISGHSDAIIKIYADNSRIIVNTF